MELETSSGVAKPTALLGTFALLSILYVVGKVVYQLYFSPLRHIPGPKLNAISRIPWVRHILAGTTVDNTVRLHREYGEVVRISPNEVSFISGETAFPDIYGFRTGKLRGHLNMQKDRVWYAPPMNGVPSILIDNDEGHSRGRRILSHAFSEKALSEQEGLIQKYVDKMVFGLKDETSKSDKTVDMTRWYNWSAFDIVADLLFGEPFGSLDNRETHSYIALLFASIASFRMMYIMTYFPIVKYLGGLIVDPKATEKRKEYWAWVTSQTRKRVERDTQRPDFMTHILAHNNDKDDFALSDEQINSNAQLFITAGSETTATLMDGVTYLLLKHPDILHKLEDEVRGKWKTYDEITIAEVSSTPYLIAVLSEALRYFPPVPVGFQRQTGAGGEIVSGHYIPENTGLSVSHYAAYHSELNFKDPDLFVPERWMDDPRYADDKRSACQPFSFGPRNCLGKNLAYAEMRLMLAKMVWTFDMELDPKSTNWMKECKVMTLWSKPELAVRLKEVVR